MGELDAIATLMPLTGLASQLGMPDAGPSPLAIDLPKLESQPWVEVGTALATYTVRVADRRAGGPALARNRDVQPVTRLAKSATHEPECIGISGDQSLIKGALSGRRPAQGDLWAAGNREAES